MNLKGKQAYNTSAQQIWDILMDADKLAKITPGVSKLEQTSPDHYTAISEVKIGPVKGAFKGELAVMDKEEPSGFTLKVKQKSKIGNADATVRIALHEPDAGQCELSFDGKAKLSGTLARTGQRVLSGVANSMTRQFFEALEAELGAVEMEVAEPVPEPMREAVETLATAAKPAVEAPKGLWARFLSWLSSLFGK